jgi:hypothetical protein
MKNSIKIFIPFLSLFFLATEIASAQSLNLSSLGNTTNISQSDASTITNQAKQLTQANTESSFSINIYPNNPGPNTKTSISIENYSIDLNNSIITWSVDGKQIQSGQGLKSINITTSKLGVITKVHIDIKTAEGMTVSKDIPIRPTQIDLVWQANSYVPPFYEGKALYSGQSLMKLVALPNIIDSNGKNIDPGQFVYKWTKNGGVLGNVSGYGKNYIYIQGDILGEPINIKVDISSTLDGGISASKEITYSPTDPVVAIYENSPLFGYVFENALPSTAILKEQEMNLVGIPYFFDATSRNDSDLKYNWIMNGNPAGGQNGDSIVFRNEKNLKGTSNISLRVQDTSKIGQFAGKQFSLNFGN